MRPNVVNRLPWDVETDVLAVTVPSDETVPEYLAEIDRRLGGAIGRLREVGALPGKLWGARLLPASDMGARFVLVVGVDDGSAIDELGARRLGAVIIKALVGMDVGSLAVHLPDELVSRGAASQAAIVELLTRGLIEGAADPRSVYTEPGDVAPELDSVTFVVESGERTELAERAERGRVIGEGGNRTRRLAHRAANDVSPEVLADEASDLAAAHGLELTVLGPTEAQKLGMGLFMSVAQGSDNEPRFIVLRSKPELGRDASGRLLAMVGKGVTFDTGGISLKPPANMGEMKTDKTGACTVLNAIATAAQLAPELPLLAVAPAVENMPGPRSTRPGDVVKAMNGKTVEINNTDAEGRLILADALTWTEQQGATHVVDVATLTGAMARALGRYMTGGFGTTDSWWEQVASAAARQGEPLWRMPLVEDLRKDLDSPFADLSNIGTVPEGGAITAALFLREFTDLPLVHLDIAGTAFLSKVDPFSTKGSTGVMHATLVELALAGAQTQAGGAEA
ncbi:MAG: leucyl aminopeptidase [Candidatus Limnocylindrales bacterium]